MKQINHPTCDPPPSRGSITLSALPYVSATLGAPPWALAVICRDLNLLLLFNKSTAIKTGLQLCFHPPDHPAAAPMFSAPSTGFIFLSCLFF